MRKVAAFTLAAVLIGSTACTKEPRAALPTAAGMGDYDATARKFLSDGDFYGALAWVQQAVENDPEDYRARFMRSVLNSQRWRSDDASSDLERVATVEPLNELVALARLQLALISNVQEKEVLTMLMNYAKTPEGYWVARFLSQVLVEREQYAQAAWLLKPLVESQPRPDPWLLNILALALSNIGQLEKAVELSRQAVLLLPQTDFYRRLAARLYQSGDIPAADDAMRECIMRYPNRFNPMDSFVDSLRSESDPNERRRRYAYVMASQLETPGGRITQARYMHDFGDVQEALAILENVAETAPLRYRAEALRQIGRIYGQTTGHISPGMRIQPEKAKAYLHQAAEMGDGEAAGVLAFAYDYPREGKRNPAKAHEFYQQALQRGDMKSLSNLGIMYRSGRGIPKDPEKALILYLKAMHAGHAAAYNNAAWLMLKEPTFWDAEVAVKWAEHAVTKEPCNPHFNTLIRIYLHIGDPAAADQAWQRWHRWWSRAHTGKSALPKNFQGLRDTIEQKRIDITGGENS